MPKGVTLKSGDIILSNWVSVFGRFATFAHQRWGHAGLIVNIDDVPHVYEISIESGRPTTIPVSEYMRQANLKELAVRQLRNPLSGREERRYKEALLTYQKVRYPHLSGVLERLVSSRRLKSSEETGEYLCSELIYAVFREMGWVGSVREVFGDSPVLPDVYVPEATPVIDGLYESTVKIILRRQIPREMQVQMLRPQLEALMGHLVD
jgi:hypothetical protein